MKTRLEEMFFSTQSWMDRYGQRLMPWLLIGNLAMLAYLVVLTRDARDGAWSADFSASRAASNSDDSHSQIEAMDANLRRLRTEVDQLSATLMFRTR